MKLHEIPNNSPLRIEVKDGLVNATFHHIDGMYSYCTTEDGQPFHLSAMAPVKLVGGRYEIDFNPKSDEEMV